VNPARRIPAWFGPVALLAFLFLLPSDRAIGGDRALWLRYPAISPDGSSIAFEFRGNLWRVSANGGVASPLTVGESYNSMPVWSPDGSKIAFASRRDGNYEIYQMNADGSGAMRLTNDAAFDFEPSWRP